MKLLQLLRVFFHRVAVPFQWLFVRLPKPFSLPLVFFLFIWFSFLFPLFVGFFGHFLVISFGLFIRIIQTKSSLLKPIFGTLFFLLGPIELIISALVTLMVALAGILMSHWLAGKLYKLYRRLTEKPHAKPVPVYPSPRQDVNNANNPLAGYQKIGIILSGGGAKGAYQAGAMRAIYEFLETYDAHQKVQMIAGTSIGSWNALFWLADLIKSPKNEQFGVLERWWREINVKNIILPIRYVPTRQNYLLSNQPWKNNFDNLFKDTPAGERLLYHAHQPFADDAVRFYFTHSNIGKADLHFTTNRDQWKSVTPNLPGVRSRPVVAPGTYEIVNQSIDPLNMIRTGVFSSMDIPPLFPYTSIKNEFFEDGGVIDNLPIRFGTEIEECDLLFVLPLNASFEKTVDQRSLIRRLARVTEIRQGVLERNSFKMIYLYNELASLRGKNIALEAELKTFRTENASGSDERTDPVSEGIASRALRRQHKVVHVFSICPAPELRICTTEFWKTKEAGEAFQFMYEATKNELCDFTKFVTSDQIRMALVSPETPDNQNGNFEGPNKNISLADSLIEDQFEDDERPILKVTDNVRYYVSYFHSF